MEVNVITLENGKDYIIIDAIEDEGNKYLILVNENDEEDMCIRKIKVKDNKEYLIRLNEEDEFDRILAKFYLKFTGKDGENE